MKIFLLLIFWGLWFLNSSSRLVLSPLLPIIEDELAITHALAGSLFFSMAVGATISVFMSGWIAKHLGYKRSVIYSFIAMGLVLFCLRYAHTYYDFAAFFFFMGFASGIYLPCAVPLITSLVSRVNWGKTLGFHDTAASLSFFAMPLLVALALRFFYWKSIFVILSGACVMLIISFWALVPDPHPREARSSRYSQIFRRREFWIITILWVMAAMTTTGIYNIIPLFLVKERGMQLESANTIFGFSRIGGVLATILVGFLLDRYAVKKILFFILLIAGLSTVGMALAHAFWLLVCMLIIQATVGVVFFTSATTAISTFTPLEERSTFIGVIIAISAIFSFGVVPVSLGAVADRWNFQIGIFVIGVLTTLSCVLVRGVKKMVDPFEPDPL
jgi:MFS family permease